MAVQYNRLWKLLIDMKMKKTALKSAAGVSANVMARLGKDEYISLESLEKICGALNCGVDDILEAAKILLAGVYPFKRPVRLLGITLSSLTPAKGAKGLTTR